MANTNAYAAFSATAPLAPYQFDRRSIGAHDVRIEILYCGICHSDIHTVRGDWGPAAYPVVPGHEIVGRVTEVGTGVSKFKVGDIAGVGCFVDSCGTCPSCSRGLEQFCQVHTAFTYNSTELDKVTPTQGGYSTQIVVKDSYALQVSPNLPLEGVAPLLCAGITTYSPLKAWGAGPGKKVAVLGLGGLGHMAVKFAKAMGAEVTMLSGSANKQADAQRLGATGFVLTSDKAQMAAHAGKFDLIIDTVSAQHDLNQYLNLLGLDGTLVLVGAPAEPLPVSSFALLFGRKRIAGSLIGGIPETQEMLDFCAQHNVVSEVEVIPISYVNEAYERILKSDVRYRFVIDMASMKG